jgi:hypothetical protein
MVTNCPVCKKRFIPIKAVVGLKSKCSQCKSSFRAIDQKNSITIALLFLAATWFLKFYLKAYINENVTLVTVLVIAFIFYMLTTNIYEVNEPDS